MNNSKDSIDINDINIDNMFFQMKNGSIFCSAWISLLWKAWIIKYPILTEYIKDSDGYKYLKYLTMLINVKSSSMLLKYKNI